MYGKQTAIFALLSLATWHTGYAGSVPADTLVIDAHRLYSNIPTRTKSLGQYPASFRDQVCPRTRLCIYEPSRVIDGDDRTSGQVAVEQGVSLWNAVGQYVSSGNTQSLIPASMLLLTWTRADAMTSFTGRRTRARHYIKVGLLPMITAYGIMRHAGIFSSTEEKEVEKWFTRVVVLVDQNNIDGVSKSDGNNSRYSRDLVNMAWGVLSQDAEYFQKGIRRFHHAIQEMNADGSFPREMERRSYALGYHNLALSILIPMAEIAEQQSVNLYNYTWQGKTIHDAVGFLTQAYIDTGMVIRHSDVAQDTSRIRNHLSWTEIYLARFPDHENSVSIINLRQSTGYRLGRVDSFSGANLSCLFAVPREDLSVPSSNQVSLKDTLPSSPGRFSRVACPRWFDD